MGKDNKMLFLIIDETLLEKENDGRRKYSPKVYFKTIFCKKILEQIFSFIFINVFYIFKLNFFVLFLGSKIRWINKFSTSKKFTDLDRLKKWVLISILLNEEIEISIKENEIIQCRKIAQKSDFLSSYYSIFTAVFKNNIKNCSFKDARIITTISSEPDKSDLQAWKKVTCIAKILNMNLDILNFNFRNIKLLYNCSYMTRGIYSKMTKKKQKFCIKIELLNILVTLFLPSVFVRQFLKLPFHNQSAGNFEKKNIGKRYLCNTCYSIFSFFPIYCTSCGNC